MATLSLAVIIVCAVAGCVVLMLVVWRVVRCLRRRRDARLKPIPPPQPLAHHRELASADRLARPSTFYEPPSFPWATASSSRSLRSTSPLLFPPGPGDLDRHGSLPSTSDLTSISDTELVSARPFLHSDNRMPSSSTASSEPHSPGLTDSTEPYSPLSPPVMPAAASTARPQSQFASHLRDRSQSSAYTLPRPASLASNLTTRSRTTTLRGAPHSMYSRVEIVLPTPLSEGAEGGAVRAGDQRMSIVDGGRRMSMADGWASQLATGSASGGSMRPTSSRSGGSSRSHSRSQSRERRVLQRDIQADVGSQPQRMRGRTTSQSSVSSVSPALSSVEAPPSSEYFPPPVPRIPSIYNTLPEGPPVPRFAHSRTDSAASEGARYEVPANLKPAALPAPAPRGPPARLAPAVATGLPTPSSPDPEHDGPLG